jgi:hypothetical protein
MRRHVIIGHFGSDDRCRIALGTGESATHLNLVTREQSLGFGINSALFDLARIGVYPTEIGLDLLVLAAHVYAADTRISRNNESQDSWTRELRLVVPVSDPDRWTNVTSVLIRILNFLTGDLWKINFRPRPRSFNALTSQRPRQLIFPHFDNIALFSGGLDSLINAINELQADRLPLFVSHAGDGATSDVQNILFDALKRQYHEHTINRLRLWMTFPYDLVTRSEVEKSTRGRSFLFFALGIFAGSGLEGNFTLFAPENGLIAINVPLDPLRLGALSTRTMHPFYIARWNELLTRLEIPARIENPYWNQTKGEMVSACANRMLLSHLTPSSMSCSSPSKGRWQGLGIQNCGFCLPCLVRRASLNAGFGRGADQTSYTLKNITARPLDTRQSTGQQIRSFQLAIERLQSRPDLARILIHKPGSLSDETPDRQAAIASVYQRGLNEVGRLLAGVRTSPG